MKPHGPTLLALLAALSPLVTSAPIAELNGPARFIAVDLFIDPRGEPLGAYQVEISDPDGIAEIVGIEGGEHPAYSEPPFYDPAALRSGHRIVLAAFSTSPQLPRSDTRVASIHLRVAGDRDPELALVLEVALAASGAPIQASAHLEGVDR
jgi:hypothetical protein